MAYLLKKGIGPAVMRSSGRGGSGLFV